MVSDDPAETTDPGRAALAAIDEVLAQQPHKPGHGFTEAIRSLAALRNQLTASQRAHGTTPQSRAVLERVNAVISTVLAGHFPLGKIPWKEIEAARAMLADIVERTPPPRL